MREKKEGYAPIGEDELSQGLKKLFKQQNFPSSEKDEELSKSVEENPMDLKSSIPNLKAQLRAKLSEQLADTFRTSELIEGLVDFLSDLVEEDPRHAKLLGIG